MARVRGGLGLKVALSPTMLVGFAAGLIVAAPLLVFLGIVPLHISVNDTLVGAIVGATIAGFVSIAGQLLIIKDNERRHELSDRQIDQAHALSLLLKVLEISDKSAKARNISWVSEIPSSGLTITQFDHSTGKHEPCYFHMPVSSSHNDIHFDHAEMALCIRLEQSVLFNTLNDLERMYRTLIETQIIYRKYHRKILDHAKEMPSLKNSGRRMQASTNSLDPEFFVVLSDSRSFIMEHSIKSAQLAEKCRLMLISLLTEKFSLKIGMTMIDDLPGAVRPIGT